MKKVSVIIPCYNGAEFLDECLEHFVNQTYKNIEIIICDDGSTDNTWEKMQEWQKKDDRIVILRNETNLFAAATRNRCIEAATGEYIALSDADDYSALNRIETEVKALEEHPDYDFVGATIVCVDETGEWNEIRFKAFPQKKDFIWGISYAHASVIFKAEVLRAVGGYRVAKETRRGEDLDLFLRLGAAGFKGFNIPDRLYFYREDRNAYGRRKYRYRIAEAIIRYKGYKGLGLYPLGILGVIKPLIVGLVPNFLHKYIKGVLFKMKRKNQDKQLCE